MLCKDCRFSLPCYAGRLDGDDSELLMCPVCEKLVVTKHTGPQEITLYYLECEQRPYKPLFRNEWRNEKYVTLNAPYVQAKHAWEKNPVGPPPTEPHTIAERALKDPMGSISKFIRIKPCWKCGHAHALGIPDTFLKFTYVDLDELEADEERKAGTTHVWSITPRRQKTR